MIGNLFLGKKVEVKQDTSILVKSDFYLNHFTDKSNDMIKKEDNLIRIKLNPGTIVRLVYYDLNTQGIVKGKVELRDDSYIGIQYKTVGKILLYLYRDKFEKVIDELTEKLKPI